MRKCSPVPNSSPEEARRIATYLTTANLTGHDSHGVIRVPVYIRWKKMGSVVPDQTAELVVDTPSLAVVDGKFGYGQTVAPQAVRIGIEKCRASGLAAVALRNAGHIGRVGDWAEMAAAEGLVSVHFVNAAGSVLVAPYGGVERRLSTAPYCVGIPRQGQGPIVLDFATSIVAEGKVLVASRGGKKLPKGALIDARRQFERGPDLALRAAQRRRAARSQPGQGRHPGFRRAQGLGSCVDLRIARRCPDRHRRHRGRTGASPTACSRSMSIPRWWILRISSTAKSRVMSTISGIPGRPPVSMSVLIPGEPEAGMRADRTKNGVPLPDDTWAAIVNTARDVGVSEVSIQKATA